MPSAQSGGTAPAIWKIFVLCVVSALSNALVAWLVNGIVKAPLYLDTVFTIAVCFCAGVVPALFTGVALSPAFTRLLYTFILRIPDSTGWLVNIFTICTVVEIILVSIFRARIKPRQGPFLKEPLPFSFTGVFIQLITLVALDCVAVSVSGGIIDFGLTLASAPKIFSPEDTFKFSLLRNNMPFLAAAILARVPINIVDRFIAIFAGYGISLLYRKFLGRESRGDSTPGHKSGAQNKAREPASALPQKM